MFRAVAGLVGRSEGQRAEAVRQRKIPPKKNPVPNPSWGGGGLAQKPVSPPGGSTATKKRDGHVFAAVSVAEL